MEQALYTAVAPYMVTCGMLTEILFLALALPRGCRVAIFSVIPARFRYFIYADAMAIFVSRRRGIHIHAMLEMGVPRSLYPTEKAAFPMWYPIEQLALSGAPITDTTARFLAMVPQAFSEKPNMEMLLLDASTLGSGNVLSLIMSFAKPNEIERKRLVSKCLHVCAAVKQPAGNAVKYLLSQPGITTKDITSSNAIRAACTTGNRAFIDYLAIVLEKKPSDILYVVECEVLNQSFNSHNTSIIKQVACGKWGLANRMRSYPGMINRVTKCLVDIVFQGFYTAATEVVNSFKLVPADFTDDLYDTILFTTSDDAKPSETLAYLMQPPFNITKRNIATDELIIYLVEHDPSALRLIAGKPFGAKHKHAIQANVLSLIAKHNYLESLAILGEAPYSIRGDDIRDNRLMPLRVAAIEHNAAAVAAFLAPPFNLNALDIEIACGVMLMHHSTALMEAEVNSEEELDMEEYDTLYDSISAEKILSGIEFLRNFAH